MKRRAIPWDEQKLVSKLMEKMREELQPEGYVCLRHEDSFTSGIPDISVTAFGRTSWWEAKHANPDFDSRGIQELTMLRLAKAGYARYIIFDELKTTERTFIVEPRNLGGWRENGIVAPGFNYSFIISTIREVHRV